MAIQRIHHPDRLNPSDDPRRRARQRTMAQGVMDEAYDYIIERQTKIAAEHG